MRLKLRKYIELTVRLHTAHRGRSLTSTIALFVFGLKKENRTYVSQWSKNGIIKTNSYATKLYLRTNKLQHTAASWASLVAKTAKPKLNLSHHTQETAKASLQSIKYLPAWAI